MNFEFDDNYSNHFFRRDVAIEIRNANVFDDLIHLKKNKNRNVFVVHRI